MKATLTLIVEGEGKVREIYLFNEKIIKKIYSKMLNWAGKDVRETNKKGRTK